MLERKLSETLSCVFVDLNTQRDLFDQSGAYPVLSVDGVYQCLRRTIAWVKRNQVPVISTVDLRRRSEYRQHLHQPLHLDCNDGQSKLEFTLLSNRRYIAGDNTLSVSIDLFDRHQQIIFPQRTKDLFGNPKADRFITQLKVDEFIIIGALAEQEVKAVALGLLARNKRVTVVRCACGAWSDPEMDLAMRQIAAKGADIITLDELLARRLPRRFRYTADSVVSSHRPFRFGDSARPTDSVRRPTPIDPQRLAANDRHDEFNNRRRRA
jgi:nicotinamidase-related amidase